MPNTLLILVILALIVTVWVLIEIIRADRLFWKAQRNKDKQFWQEPGHEYDDYINQN